MDLESYEETRLKKDDSWAKYLKEGFTVALVVWNDKVHLDAGTPQAMQRPHGMTLNVQ